MVELNKITFHDVGIFDMNKVIDNFDRLSDAIDETERLRASLGGDLESLYPLAVSYVMESRGDHTALEKAVRSEMKLKQVFITAGTDGSDGVDTQIELLIDGSDPLCEPITLKASESRGKVVIGEVLTYPTITRFNEIVIRADSDRRIVVTMNFGGM